MSSSLSFELKQGVFSLHAKGIWCLKSGTSSEKKKLDLAQRKALDFLIKNKCDGIELLYSSELDTDQNLTSPVDGQKTYHTGQAEEKEDTWDSLLLAFFATVMEQAGKKKISVDVSKLPRNIQNLLEVKLKEGNKEKEPDTSILVGIGEAVLAIPKATMSSLDFFGEVCLSLFRFSFGKARCSARDVWQEIYACSVASLPIISLVSLLLGLILAFVGAIQLKNLGAELYIASLVTLSMVRVMGPILTGIVVAGKTGASYAATLGTMQVNEEIDALNTFGISPVDFLILPRVLALSIMMPFLTMYSNCMGILGGFLVATLGMDISPAAFIENVRFMGSIDFLWIGLFHSFVFGIVIALAGCYQGLICGRSAEAVGVATTKAVVNSIVGIIVTTSIITIVLTINSL